VNLTPLLASTGFVILLKWTALLAVGWLVHGWLRSRHARWRLILWRSILCFALILPLVQLVRLPGWNIPLPVRFTGTKGSDQTSSPGASRDLVQLKSSVANAPSPFTESTTPEGRTIRSSFSRTDIFLTVWAVGCLLAAARLIRLHRQLASLQNKSRQPAPGLDWLAQQIQLRLNFQPGVAVHVSDDVASPFVCGVWKPAIILPRTLAQHLPSEEMSALLSHEVAHLRHHDLAWCVAWRWLQAIFWFHPLVWHAPAAHNLACEQEADRVASAQLPDQETYAQLLARLALRVLALPALETQLTMNGSSHLVRRLDHLTRSDRQRWNWHHTLVGFGLAVLIFLPTACCRINIYLPPGSTVSTANHGTTHEIRVGAAARPRLGLVALWSGEDNGLDSVSGAVAVNQTVTYTDGVVGRAFCFSTDSYPRGTYTGMEVADRPEFILTNSLTIEGWIRPRGNGYCILSRGDNRPGFDPYTISMHVNDHFTFTIADQNNANATVETIVPYYHWTHIAAVLDGETGTMSIYTNGQLAVQTHTDIRPLGELIPSRNPGLGIGNVNDGFNNFPFIGDVDEIALYNRALSVDEIHGIYQANAANAQGIADPLPSRTPFHEQ
jgi:beta-lactamase regulating signal transducer with metallopeptidase domain